jgi:multidrug efflux pump
VLNVKLTQRNPHNHGWFYRFTEPFFTGLDRVYGRALHSFMQYRWVSFILLIACFGAIWYFQGTIKSELAPLEDRSSIRATVVAPEGTDFDVTESIIYRLTDAVMDSVPEYKMIFGITAPNRGGAGGANTGFISLGLVEPQERDRSQQQIYDQLVRMTRRISEARVFPNQEQTISTSFGAGLSLPVQFVIQNLDFQKLEEIVPKFLDEARQDPTFANVDVNLKFNKPEIQIEIDRLKAAELGVSVLDISQTVQLALSGRRFGYFLMNGKQYQVIGQVDRDDRDEPIDLTTLYVRNNAGQMIQLDNVVRFTETSNPPVLIPLQSLQSGDFQRSPGARQNTGRRNRRPWKPSPPASSTIRMPPT